MNILADIVIKNPLPTTSPRTVENILYIVFGVLGGLSVIVIIWAGLKYTMSAGDPSKTSEAKNQILYAAIGIAVALLAGVIVRFAAGSVG